MRHEIPVFLSEAETTAILGVTRQRVHQIYLAGVLRPSVYVGGKPGFLREHVEAVRDRPIVFGSAQHHDGDPCKGCEKPIRREEVYPRRGKNNNNAWLCHDCGRALANADARRIQAARAKRLEDAGLCVRCAKEPRLYGRTRCQDCQEAMRKYNRARYRQQSQEATQ